MEIDDSKNLYKKIFEQSCDAVIVIDAHSGRIVELNAKAARLAGLHRNDLIGQPFHKVLFASLHEAMAPLIQQALKQNTVCECELSLQLPEGESVPTRACAYALSGKDTSYVCLSFSSLSTFIFSDSGGTPTAKIRQQAWEIRGLQSQMVQLEKMASLGSLMAGVAHEINTPLGALRSNTDTFLRLLRKVRDALVERQQASDAELLDLLNRLDEPAQVSETAAERIVRIVNSLRSYARIDKPEMELADIHEGIESTLTLVHHELKNRVEVRKEYTALPLIQCYPNQLTQVFLNLLVNASHAIGDRGVIRIVTRMVDDGHISIAITDTGTGIKPELMDRIFNPGFTTKGAEHGTGLGLSIVHKIVEQHHGRIDVQSEVGRGTTVTIILPIEQPE